MMKLEYFSIKAAKGSHETNVEEVLIDQWFQDPTMEHEANDTD